MCEKTGGNVSSLQLEHQGSSMKNDHMKGRKPRQTAETW